MFGRSRGFRGFRPRNSTHQALHVATLTLVGVVSGETFSGYHDTCTVQHSSVHCSLDVSTSYMSMSRSAFHD